MKYLFVFIFFCNSFLYSQTNEKIDSLAYYSNLSNSNIKADKYKKALFHTQKAINYSLETRNIAGQADQTYRLGKIYFDLKKYNDAIKTFHKSIEFYKELEPNSNYAYCNYYLGLSYIEKRNFNAAEICFNNAKSTFDKLTNVNSAEINNLLNLQKGIISKARGNYDLASVIFRTIIAEPDTPEISNSRTEALYQIGTIEATKDKYNLALNYLTKALELSIKNKNKDQESNTLLALSTVYEKMLDKNNAFSYLKQHLNLKESISILNNKRLERDDYDEFRESERLKEISQIDSKNKQQEKANKFSKLISILAIALISILSLLSLSLYKNNIIRTQSNLMLKEKNKELEIAKDKAEKASNARSEFLSTVSHELRTPLNAINGITHLLLEENPKKSQMNYLSSLKFSGDYLTKFINEILEINKIDSNKFEIEYTILILNNY